MTSKRARPDEQNASTRVSASSASRRTSTSSGPRSLTSTEYPLFGLAACREIVDPVQSTVTEPATPRHAAVRGVSFVGVLRVGWGVGCGVGVGRLDGSGLDVGPSGLADRAGDGVLRGDGLCVGSRRGSGRRVPSSRRDGVPPSFSGAVGTAPGDSTSCPAVLMVAHVIVEPATTTPSHAMRATRTDRLTAPLSHDAAAGHAGVAFGL